MFLFAGVMMLVMPFEAMTAPVALPGPLLRFIDIAEVLGAAGLILPGLLRIRVELTALAAAGLAVIMVGAVVITVMGGSIGGWWCSGRTRSMSKWLGPRCRMARSPSRWSEAASMCPTRRAATAR